MGTGGKRSVDLQIDFKYQAKRWTNRKQLMVSIAKVGWRWAKGELLL